jgi:hypothetical protein
MQRSTEVPNQYTIKMENSYTTSGLTSYFVNMTANLRYEY